MKIDWKRKLSSRKLWLAVAGFVSGLILAFGGAESTAATVSGCILQGASVIGYLLAEGLTAPCEIDVLLTGDAGIQALNREQRGVDSPTDVLSFPEFELSPGELPDEEDADPGTGLIPLGDMVINLERAAAQAKEYGHSNRRELAYLVIHSVLHLLGYDHVDEGAKKRQMRRREEEIMKKLDLTR